MTEYLINVGEFNIIVLPDQRQYFLLDDHTQAMDLESRFIQGNSIAYDSLTPLWFDYRSDESWKDFSQKPHRLGGDTSEAELIDMYVLKKFNFGSLVAVRDSQGGKVRVFKRDMLTKA